MTKIKKNKDPLGHMPEIFLGLIVLTIVIVMVWSLIANIEEQNIIKQEKIQIELGDERLQFGGAINSEEGNGSLVILDNVSGVNSSDSKEINLTGDYCIETDSGLNYLDVGKIKAGNIDDKEDYCVGEKSLIEFYCEDLIGKQKIFECPGICKEGACAGNDDSIKPCTIKNIYHERQDNKVNNSLFFSVEGYFTNESLFLSGTKTEFDGGIVSLNKSTVTSQLLKLDDNLSAIDASRLLNILDDVHLIKGGDIYCAWPEDDK